MSEVTLTMLEVGIGIIVEGVILGFIFQFIASKETEKQEQHLKQELQNLEKQLRQDFDKSANALKSVRDDILNQIKESTERN